jgi:hypothetical protein
VRHSSAVGEPRQFWYFSGMRNPAWLVVLSLVLTPLAALAREPPPEVQGLVLAAGQPVFHALVQVLAEPDGAPVQEAWTDERGRFTVDMPKHSMVVRAQRTVLDAQGASHRLRALVLSTPGGRTAPFAPGGLPCSLAS